MCLSKPVGVTVKNSKRALAYYGIGPFTVSWISNVESTGPCLNRTAHIRQQCSLKLPQMSK
jgi:hypothetical protein